MVESVNGNSSIRAMAGVQASAAASSKTENVEIYPTDGKPPKKYTPRQQTAIQSLKQLVKEGKIEYNDTNFIEDVLNYVMDHKSGDYIRIKDFAPRGEKITFGEAKQILKLNLPDGSMLPNKTERGGGNFDLYHVPQFSNGVQYLDIFIDDLEVGTGLSKSEIKQICGQ